MTTTKDLTLLAEAFRTTRPDWAGDYTVKTERAHQWSRTRAAVIAALIQSNPRFDADRFIDATEK
jgi:hypothetical protein